MALSVATGLPPQSSPLVDDKRNILPVWYQALVNLINRTGGGPGVDVAAVKQTADAALTAAAAAVDTANNALAQAAASAKKAANLADLTNISQARINLGLGPAATSATVTSWPSSTGGARIAVDGTFTQVAGSVYSQIDTQTLINQVKALSQALAQLINDEITFKTIGP